MVDKVLAYGTEGTQMLRWNPHYQITNATSPLILLSDLIQLLFNFPSSIRLLYKFYISPILLLYDSPASRRLTHECKSSKAHSLICISRFLLEKGGLKCQSGPKDSPRGLVRRRDKAPSQH
ncbi:hypothetical protein TNCV_677491 [Trichonephila clavipes]|nr:hypothetical protein TNCV_677491 [Trichonephila clavipes]